MARFYIINVVAVDTKRAATKGATMEIKDGFYLTGFTRQDKGDEGAVFVRYEDVEDTRKPEIRETPMLYGGAGTVNYTLSVPKPQPRKVSACAIVTRSSKNCYQAMAYDAKRIESFRADSLDALRRMISAFFGGK